MPVIISLLRGVNVGRSHRITMEALRDVYTAVGLENPQTYVQSGNVVCRARDGKLGRLSAKIESAFEGAFGFHSDVILRTAAELRDVVARNPFAGRTGLDPAKLVVVFLAGEIDAATRSKLLALKPDPEELRVEQRELFIYFPEGMGRSKLPVMMEKSGMKGTGTMRNWNTVTKLLELAVKLETAPHR
jgi:uncharacterized protein (DUF1697 family)